MLLDMQVIKKYVDSLLSCQDIVNDIELSNFEDTEDGVTVYVDRSLWDEITIENSDAHNLFYDARWSIEHLNNTFGVKPGVDLIRAGESKLLIYSGRGAFSVWRVPESVELLDIASHDNASIDALYPDAVILSTHLIAVKNSDGEPAYENVPLEVNYLGWLPEATDVEIIEFNRYTAEISLNDLLTEN